MSAPVKGGVLQIPAATRVGRWTGSASYSASKGRVVLAGHIDRPGVTNGGAMAGIRNAKAGTVVWVSDSSGKVYRFVVTANTQYAKTALPSWTFYGGGALQLELITCGGKVMSNGHHVNNVVVSAVRR